MKWWRAVAQRRRLEPQLDAELQFHIEKLTQEYVEGGMQPDAARRKALLDFGGSEQIKEDLRDVHRWPFIEQTWTNIRVAARVLRKSPGFAITVILTLALGIGANTAVFSAIDAILLRPLPFPEGDQLMRIEQRSNKLNASATPVAPVRLDDWNRLNQTFQAITGYYLESATEATGIAPEKVTRAWVSGRFLQVWGVAPALGRDFAPAEERFGGPNACLISDRLWRSRFGGDPAALGKRLRFDKISYTVVGVMPANFLFPEPDVDLWSPAPSDAPFALGRELTWFTAVGRLRPGVTVAQGRADLARVQANLGAEYPKSDSRILVDMQPLKETVVGSVRRSLWLLFGSVSLLLLIACSNIAALLLARGTQRGQEIAVRFSLGASRSAVVGQLLTEAWLLAVFGAALGLVFTWVAGQAFRTFGSGIPRAAEISINGRLLAYSLVCSIVTTLICALVPALSGTRRGLSGALATNSRTQVSSRHPLQWTLVGVQVALAVTLLTGAGLLVRSFQALGQISTGFDAEHVLTMRVSGSWGETTDMPKLNQRIGRTLEALRSLPGVESAATSLAIPGVPDSHPSEIRLLDRENDPRRTLSAESRIVSRSYFSTVRIPLISGEECREPGGPPTVIVNRSFVNSYFNGTTPIGHQIEVPGQAYTLRAEIRGVVGDARETGINREAGPTVYWCMTAPLPSPYYLIRTHGEPMSMAAAARHRINEVEPARAVFEIKPLTDHLGDAFAESRLRMMLLVFFALTAVSLASIGLYGTLSYLVAMRRREVGLRLALGAMRGQILRRFVGEGLSVAAAGCVVGLLLAAAAARLVAGMLFGVSPSDPQTLCAVIALILAVASVASLIPAYRAARLDPVNVLREQ